MPERYIVTPFDVVAGTNTWPADFRNIEEAHKAAPGNRKVSNVHSIAGSLRATAVSGNPGFISDLLAVPGVIDVGPTIHHLRNWFRDAVNAAARDLRAEVLALAQARRQSPQLADLAVRFFPDQFRKGQNARQGTYTYAWTGSDTDPWTGDISNVMTTTYFNTGSMVIGDCTIEIQSNAGAVVGPSGGPLKAGFIVSSYNVETGPTQNVKLTYSTYVDSNWRGPLLRIDPSDSYTFYWLELANQSGNDFRLQRVVSQSETEIATAAVAQAPPHDMRGEVSDDSNNDPVINGKIWSGAEPGSADLTHTDTDAAALGGAGTRAGFMTRPERNVTVAVDDLEITITQSGLSVATRMLIPVGV